MTETVAVTGATGRVGGRVARRLAAAGAVQRLVVRDAARAPQLPGATAAVATYADPGAVRAALTGCDVVLFVSAAENEDRVAEHRTFVDAAVAAGVRHVVYTSFFAAGPDATFTHARDHWHTEEHLRASGVGWTFLRDNLYTDFLPHFAGEDGVIRGPAGDGRFAPVALDDVADVATAVLLDPAAHAGRTYDLTGPESFTLTEAAARLTAAGRPTTFHDETLEEAFASRASFGAPAWLVEAWVSTYTAIAAGELDGVTDHVEKVTGHPATGLEEVLRREAQAR
jgi:uncharacterized protein YbjT (DUF2867 family)